MTTITNPDTDGDGGLDATGTDPTEDQNQNGAAEETDEVEAEDRTDDGESDDDGLDDDLATDEDTDLEDADLEDDVEPATDEDDSDDEGQDGDDADAEAEADAGLDPTDEADPEADVDPTDEAKPAADTDDEATDLDDANAEIDEAAVLDDEDGETASESVDQTDDETDDAESELTQADAESDDAEAELTEADAEHELDDDAEAEPTEADAEHELDDDAEAEPTDTDVEADTDADAEAELTDTDVEADPDDEAESAQTDTGPELTDDEVESESELTDVETELDGAAELVTEPAPATNGARAGVELLSADELGSDWSLQQLAVIVTKSLVVCLAIALAGFGLGASRGEVHIARSEFVYSLTDSVPDSFLREDRRLLTQVATFTSDAVVIPVADRFNLDPDGLRDKMVIETVELSEVLRLEVTDPDPGRALGINRALVEGYLQVLSEATPIDDGRDLTERRDQILAALDDADQRQLALEEAAEQDAVLAVEQESIQRRVDLTRDRVDGLQGRLDDALTELLAQSRREEVAAELAGAEAELAQLENQLGRLAAERADLATATTARPDLTREIFRLEGQLSTVEAELTERELGPLLTSSILELSDPVVIERSATEAGLQGAAIGALVSLPIAAWLAYRSRRRQLWSA